MKKHIICALSAIVCMLPGATSAQTQYFARVTLPGAAATSTGTPTPSPGTLVCSNFRPGFLPYPQTGTQGPLRLATDFDDGVAACNEIGRAKASTFKSAQYCLVQKIDAASATSRFYAYLVTAPTAVDVNAQDPAAKDYRGSAACVYHP